MPYTVTIRGTAGPERDIANVNLYVDGILTTIVPAMPSQPFTANFTHVGNVTLAISHTFVDTNGNESPPLGQTFNLPPERNRDSPEPPTTPLEVVAVYG